LLQSPRDRRLSVGSGHPIHDGPIDAVAADDQEGEQSHGQHEWLLQTRLVNRTDAIQPFLQEVELLEAAMTGRVLRRGAQDWRTVRAGRHWLISPFES
jgi:hypothetical protein